MSQFGSEPQGDTEQQVRGLSGEKVFYFVFLYHDILTVVFTW